jgi:hypothetical protein
MTWGNLSLVMRFSLLSDLGTSTVPAIAQVSWEGSRWDAISTDWDCSARRYLELHTGVIAIAGAGGVF